MHRASKQTSRPETLARTNLGGLRPGSLVNLERPMALGDRLGGHIVQGHVDSTTEVASLDPLPAGNRIADSHSPRSGPLHDLQRLDRSRRREPDYRIHGRHQLRVAIIPHTYQNTSMREYRPGSLANIEVDLLAKYVENLL